MILKNLSAKADSLIAEAKQLWLAQIGKYASKEVATVQQSHRVLDHADELLSWNIDFVVVKDEGKVIRGVIGRDQLREVINKKKIEVRTGATAMDLSKLSFRDVIDSSNFGEYYLLDRDNLKPEAWTNDLPARELIITKDKTVEGVVDRRLFKRLINLLNFARYI